MKIVQHGAALKAHVVNTISQYKKTLISIKLGRESPYAQALVGSVQ